MSNCVRLRADGSDEVAGVTPDLPVGQRQGESQRARAARLVSTITADPGSREPRAEVQAGAERERARLSFHKPPRHAKIQTTAVTTIAILRARLRLVWRSAACAAGMPVETNVAH